MVRAVDMAEWRARRNGRNRFGEILSRSVDVAGRRLLRFPLFQKILIANAALIVVAAVAASWLTARGGTADGLLDAGALAAIIVTAALLSAGVNAAILRLALRPLRELERTAARVRTGDLDVRAKVSPLADPEMERLIETFNAVLDSGMRYRRRLREVAARALEATEAERKRLARELHDGTAQTLAAIRVRLRLARACVDADLRATQLDQVGADVGEAIEEVRRMAKGLRPPSLDMLGLGAAIEAYARPFADAAGIELEYQSRGIGSSLAPEVELALYRILQESLSNVVRHSGASRVKVSLRRAADAVILSVEDDGRGFQLEEVMHEDDRGLGLFGMQERAGYVGGRVGIQSEPGAGTRVTAIMPVAGDTEETANYA